MSQRPHHHLIVGGQRSGKSRHAERLAQHWLAASAQHRVTVVATALAGDEEMRAPIPRHQADRPAGMDTAEEPLLLSRVLPALAEPGRLLLVDCLTLWLTNWLMPAQTPAQMPPDPAAWETERAAMLTTVAGLPSPVVFVSNEVGWGIIPMSSEVRHFADELGRLNQDVARQCGELTLMVAGQAWTRPVVST
jgi:adenosylcobinamide kinase/adenosylcobinamide-phosphate guanylyltransferase